MDPKTSKRQKRQENVLTLLNGAIEALNLAKEISSATPAKAVFGTVSVLLTMIKVRLLSSSGDDSQTHIRSGIHGQQNRLRRAWDSLRRRMQSPSQGNEWKGIG